MTEWDVFWKFMAQLSIVVLFVLFVFSAFVEIRKSMKKDKE